MIFMENHYNSTIGISHIRIYNNTFTSDEDDRGAPILFENNFDSTSDDVYIDNNTFMHTFYGIRLESGSGKTTTFTNLKIRNNIFYETRIGGAVTTSVIGTLTWANEEDAVFDYNLMYSASGLRWDWLDGAGGIKKVYTSLAAWNTDHAIQNHNPASADPLFMSASNFALQTTSPAKNTGIAIGEFDTDLLNVSRPQGAAWDIGAYEYVSGGNDDISPSAPNGLEVK
jgi:hypothetical protein